MFWAWAANDVANDVATKAEPSSNAFRGVLNIINLDAKYGIFQAS